MMEREKRRQSSKRKKTLPEKTDSPEKLAWINSEEGQRSIAKEQASWITSIENTLIQPDSTKEDMNLRQSGKLSNFYLQLRRGHATDVVAFVHIDPKEETDTPDDTQKYEYKITYQGKVQDGSLVQFVKELGEYDYDSSEKGNPDIAAPEVRQTFVTAWNDLLGVRREASGGINRTITTRLVNTNPDIAINREALEEMLYQRHQHA